MNKRITIKDVARAADCSFVAVSRVLSGRDLNHVSLDVQKRVRDAAERLGYKPSQAARALRTGRTNTIGLRGKHHLHNRNSFAVLQSASWHILLRFQEKIIFFQNLLLTFN